MAELVKICDPAGRERGSGFVADDRGTVVTSHEAVDGLPRLVLHGPGRTFPADAADVTPLPGLALALIRTDGLGIRPLPVAQRESIDAGTYVRLPARGWRQARVLGGVQVAYGPAGLLPAVELAIGTDGRDALSEGGQACGGPVLDATTGAVLAVLGTALRTEHRSGGFAVALRAAADSDPDGPLAALLARNAETVPGRGADLNLAGALELTAATLGAPPSFDPVARPGIAAELDAFTAGDRPVLGLVGNPGTGRTTELTALALRRGRGPRPVPTLWLSGADLHATDASLADAAARALTAASRPSAGGAGCVPGRSPQGAEGTTAAPPHPTRPGCVPGRSPQGADGTTAAPPHPGRSPQGAEGTTAAPPHPTRPGCAPGRSPQGAEGTTAAPPHPGRSPQGAEGTTAAPSDSAGAGCVPGRSPQGAERTTAALSGPENRSAPEETPRRAP
ncbi:hypothetical protein ACIPXC_18370, partial [Streptomyces sp. NPDC090021]